MRLSLSHLAILFLTMITKSLACVLFEGDLTYPGGDVLEVWTDIVDNGVTTCGSYQGDTPIVVTTDFTFVFLPCLPGYLATFQWGNPPTVWYNTPTQSGGSFGLDIAGNGAYYAKVWGC